MFVLLKKYIKNKVLFFFFWKIHPKIKSRFGVFFAFRTKQSFWGVFCLQDKTVVLRYFLSWEQYSHFGRFFWKFETFFGIAQKIKISSKKKLRPFFVFLGFDPQKFSIKMIYIHKQKLKDVLGYFWNLENQKVILGYFWRSWSSRFGVFLEK